MKKKSFGRIAWTLFFTVGYAGFGAIAYRTYLRQAIKYPGGLGRYPSDLRGHILEGRSGQAYSFMERSFGFIMDTLGLNEKGVAVWLALVTLGVTWITYCVMKKLAPRGNRVLLHLLAFASAFVMPLYIRSWNSHRYLGMQAGTIWHNSTYLGMKFAAMLLLFFYYGYQETYQERFRAGDFVWFTVLLVFVNMMKPNFIACFAPAMAVMLLTDCIASRGRTLKRQILFGIPVLLSLVVVAFEMQVLFSGDNENSGVVFEFAYNIRVWNRHPVLAVIQSGAFPFLVLLANLRSLKEDRRFRVSWLIWLFAMAEYLLLAETGRRRNHGNLSWGICFGAFLVFVVCICKAYDNVLDLYAGYRSSRKDSFLKYLAESGWNVRIRVLYLAAAVFLLGWHLLSGLHYSLMMFRGGNYAW